MTVINSTRFTRILIISIIFNIRLVGILLTSNPHFETLSQSTQTHRDARVFGDGEEDVREEHQVVGLSVRRAALPAALSFCCGLLLLVGWHLLLFLLLLFLLFLQARKHSNLKLSNYRFIDSGSQILTSLII